MSIVRENLMSRKGYTPYCGNDHCRFHMPRTRYIGGQFQCGCGWRSSFDDEFIEAYEAKWADPAPQPNLVGGHLRAQGIGRDPKNDRVVFLSLDRPPSDDELRAIHDAIRRAPAACPFCSKPTYVLPCSHCGEPDVPDDQF